MSATKQSLGDELYSGSASFGRIMALFSAIGGTVVGIILFIIGIYLLKKKTPYTASTMGLIKNAVCTSGVQNGNTFYYCDITLEFTPSGSNTPNTLRLTTQNSTPYATGQRILIWYDPTDINNVVTTKPPPYAVIGWICLASAVLIIVGGWVWWYITLHSKFAASLTGIGQGLAMLRG